MSDLFCIIDDKHVPMWRVLWVSDVPHFCGSTDCQREGQYEIRMEQHEAVWASREQRDRVLASMEQWYRQSAEPGQPPEDPS